MKKILTGLLLFPIFLSAQTKEGKITYELKIDLHRRIPEDNAQMKAMIPQFRKSKLELEYSNNQSVCKAKEEEPDIADQDNGNGAHILIKTGGSPDDMIYKNLSSQKSSESREFLGNNYLIEGDYKGQAWKMEEGSRNILGYNCKKASTKNTQGSDIIAWYTEEISIASGPQQYGGLPGMILAVDVNKSEFEFTAISIDNKVNVKDIKAPVKGKKITIEEFAKIQKDARANGGGFKIVSN